MHSFLAIGSVPIGPPDAVPAITNLAGGELRAAGGLMCYAFSRRTCTVGLADGVSRRPAGGQEGDHYDSDSLHDRSGPGCGGGLVASISRPAETYGRERRRNVEVRPEKQLELTARIGPYGKAILTVRIIE